MQNFTTFLIIIAIISVPVIIIIMATRFQTKINESKKNSQNNLGKCDLLENAPKKLYHNGQGNIFLLNYFVPIKEHENSRTAPEMKVGKGLISHPDYPNAPLFFDIVFEWYEKIIPNEKYVLQKTENGIYYLKKM